MKTSYASCYVFAFFLLCAAMSCSKESAVKTSPSSATNPSETAKTTDAAVSISNAIDPSGFLGTYTVRDEKTIYQGQANPKSSNVLIHLSYLDVQKPITVTADHKHLTMPFGTDYATNGWAYIIDYDKATKAIVLSPNQSMQKDIVAGSFETLSAIYDPKTKEGSFTTRFTALKDNGNESQLSESFWKE